MSEQKLGAIMIATETKLPEDSGFLKEEVKVTPEEIKEETEDYILPSNPPFILELVPQIQVKGERQNTGFKDSDFILKEDDSHLKEEEDINADQNTSGQNLQLELEEDTTSSVRSTESEGNKTPCTNTANSVISNTNTTTENTEHVCPNPDGNEINFNETRAPTKTLKAEVYSSGHSEDIFCKCIDCLLKFKEAKYVHKYPTFDCDQCKKSFKTPEQLKKHLKINCGVDRTLIGCNICGKGFTTKVSHANHMEKIHEGKQECFTCTHCKQILTSKSALTRHVLRHLGESKINTPITCEYCQKTLASRKSYDSHKIRLHSGNHYKCTHCQTDYKTKSALLTHIQSVHLNIFFKCDLCPKTFSCSSSLRNHKTTQHSEGAVSTRKKWTCELCGKTLKDKGSFERHLNIHNDVKPYICEDCGKCFRSEANLQQHSKTHSDERPFVCDLCGKGFRIRNHLRQHMAVHGLVNTSVKRKRKRKISKSDTDSDYSE